MIKKGYIRVLFDLAVITVGAAIYAFAVNLFMEPYHIAPGGVSGIAMMVNYLVPSLSIGVLIILINLPLFLLSARFAGGKFLIYTIVGTLEVSLIIDWTAGLVAVEVEPLIAAIFGGLLMGAGLGIVFLRGATTGGSDIAARLLRLLFRHMQMGRLMLVIDAVVVAVAGFVFGSVQNTLYSIVMLYIASTVMDFILYGTKYERVAYIISDKNEEIVRVISERLTRGATLLHGEGGYKKESKRVILCAIKRQQIALLKDMVKSIDPDAFIIVTEAQEVLGRGFTRYDKNRM